MLETLTSSMCNLYSYDNKTSLMYNRNGIEEKSLFYNS